MRKNLDALLEQSTFWAGGSRARCGRRSSYGRAGCRAFAERFATAGTEKFVEFTRGQHQQKALPNRAGRSAFRTIKFAGREISELLRHPQTFTRCFRISNSTLFGA